MINGVHLLLSSRDPEADRAFLRDVLHLRHVDAGDGWLIFALPPAEIGVHPAERNLTHPHAGNDLAAAMVYLMCDDLEKSLAELAARGVDHTPVQEAEWGIASSIPLPGGAHLGIYQPRHPVATSLETFQDGQIPEPAQG